MHDDDLTILEAEMDLADPLDQLAPLEEETGPQYDADDMLPLLTSSNSQQRMLAARAFCELEDGRAIPALTQLLDDACPLVRVSAAYALGRNHDDAAVEALILRLRKDWNGYVRKGIVWALGNSRSAQSLLPLVDALRTDIAAVRLWAASALAQMTQVSYEAVVASLPALIETMRRDAVAPVRSNCAWAIGELCRELPSNVVYNTAIDSLIETFAEDDDLGVREDARSAILKVGDARGLQTVEEIEQDGYFI